MTDRPALLTTDQAAERLGMTRNGLDVLRHRGGGPRYVKVGRKVLYDPIDIDRWIEAHKVTPGREATA